MVVRFLSLRTDVEVEDLDVGMCEEEGAGSRKIDGGGRKAEISKCERGERRPTTK